MTKASLVDTKPNGWVYILKKDHLGVRRAYIDHEHPSDVSGDKYVVAATKQGSYRVPVDECTIRVDFGCIYSWSSQRCDEKMLVVMKRAALDDTFARLDKARFKCKKLEHALLYIERIDYVTEMEENR